MDIKKPQLVKVEAFVLVFWVGSAAPSHVMIILRLSIAAYSYQ